MKIVIVGAGIAGLAAYLELKKHLPAQSGSEDEEEQQHSYTIYDPYDTSIDAKDEDRKYDESNYAASFVIGGGLGVAPNGLNVLKRLDEELLREAVRGGCMIATYEMRSRRGGLLMKMHPEATSPSTRNPDGGSKQDDSESMKTLGCTRQDIWRCLRKRVPDELLVRKKVSEVVSITGEDGKTRNIVHFKDGSPPAEADLVIGADGVKSTVRKALFPDKKDAYPPQYEGLVGIGGFLPISTFTKQNIPIAKGTMTFCFGRNGFFGYFPTNTDPKSPHRDSPYHVSELGDSLSWWSTYSLEECPKDPRSIDMEDVNRQLRERYAGWSNPIIQAIIKRDGQLVKNVYPTWTSPPIPTWSRNGIILVGDAAHALPSTSGQGSSQAFEDVESLALFLAHELRRAKKEKQDQQKAITTAAGHYESLRRPHVAKILEAARKMQNNKRDMSLLQEGIMFAAMWTFGLFPSLFAKGLKAVAEYDVSEEVEKVIQKLDKEKSAK